MVEDGVLVLTTTFEAGKGSAYVLESGDEDGRRIITEVSLL